MSIFDKAASVLVPAAGDTTSFAAFVLPSFVLPAFILLSFCLPLEANAEGTSFALASRTFAGV